MAEYSKTWGINTKTAVVIVVLSISMIVHAIFNIKSSSSSSSNVTTSTANIKSKLVGAANPKDCKTYLWKVEPHHYLFGTIHIPAEKVWDAIPNNAKRAFLESDAAYFEVDNNPEFWMNLAKCKENHQVKVTQLPPYLYQRVEKFFTRIQSMTILDLKNWKYMTIVDMVDYLSLFPFHIRQLEKVGEEEVKIKIQCPHGFEEDLYVEIAELRLKLQDIFKNTLRKEDSLDEYLQQAAKMMNKTVGGCETLEDRCELARSREKDVVQDKLEKTLSVLENLDIPQIISLETELTNLYRSVNYPEDVDLEDEDNRYYHMYERNLVMANKVAELIRSSPETRLFAAFGAQHFLGKGSVVEMLREKGFQVQRVYAFEKILIKN